MEDTKSHVCIPIEGMSIEDPTIEYLITKPDSNIVVTENDIVAASGEVIKPLRQIYCSSKTCKKHTANVGEKLYCNKLVKAKCAECEASKSQFYNKDIYGDLEKEMQVIDASSAEAQQVKPKKERKKRTKKEEVKQEVKLEGSLNLDGYKQQTMPYEQTQPDLAYTIAYERGFQFAMNLFNKDHI